MAWRSCRRSSLGNQRRNNSQEEIEQEKHLEIYERFGTIIERFAEYTSASKQDTSGCQIIRAVPVMQESRNYIWQ